MQNTVVDNSSHKHCTVEAAHCRSSTGTSSRTMQIKSGSDWLLEASCIMITDSSSLSFKVEGNCDESTKYTLLFNLAETRLDKLHFNESCVYKNIDCDLCVRMPRHLFDVVKAVLILRGVFTS